VWKILEPPKKKDTSKKGGKSSDYDTNTTDGGTIDLGDEESCHDGAHNVPSKGLLRAGRGSFEGARQAKQGKGENFEIENILFGRQ